MVFHRGVCLHGPLLFIVYVNDLSEAVQSSIAIFADDTKLYRSIITPDDGSILQSDLDQLVEWGKVWQMNFNFSKCKDLSLGLNFPSRQYVMAPVLNDIRLVRLMKKLTWALLLVTTSNLDLISIR